MSPHGRVEVSGPVGLRRKVRISAIGTKRALPERERARLTRLADEAEARTLSTEITSVDDEAHPGHTGD